MAFKIMLHDSIPILPIMEHNYIKTAFNTICLTEFEKMRNNKSELLIL